MTTVVTQLMDGWKAINRKQVRRNVFKLQKRIYQASIGTTDNCRMIEEPCEVETLKSKASKSRLRAISRLNK
jgi:protein-arginine kinase